MRRARRMGMLALISLVAGCAPSPPPSPELLARCTRDYNLWFRYHYNQAVIHTGQKMRAEFAMYQCQQGKYHPAIETLEDILRRGRFNI